MRSVVKSSVVTIGLALSLLAGTSWLAYSQQSNDAAGACSNSDYSQLEGPFEVDIVQAEALYRNAIECNPTDAIAYQNLSTLLYVYGRYEESISSIREAVRLDPSNAETATILALALSEQAHYAEAAEAFAQAIRLNPDDAYLHYSLGEALQGEDDFDRAAEAYREAIRLKPDYPEAKKRLSQMLYRQGDVEGAIAVDQKVNYYMGNDFRIFEQLPAAEVNYREAVRLNPDFAEAYIKLAVTLHDLGKVAEAEPIYQRAIQMVVADPPLGLAYVQYLYDSYSLLLKAQGRDAEADAIQQQSPDFNPGFPTIIQP